MEGQGAKLLKTTKRERERERESERERTRNKVDAVGGITFAVIWGGGNRQNVTALDVDQKMLDQPSGNLLKVGWTEVKDLGSEAGTVPGICTVC